MHSRPNPQPTDWHPQDWILVVEALCFYATSEVADVRDYDHAHRLVDGVAAEQGLEACDLLMQADR